jgi:DNA-directed RNA polymerase subunit H (RpoH/RPB5)
VEPAANGKRHRQARHGDGRHQQHVSQIEQHTCVESVQPLTLSGADEIVEQREAVESQLPKVKPQTNALAITPRAKSR